MKKQFIQFKHTPPSQSGSPANQNENADGGGNANTSGANEQARASRGQGGPDTNQGAGGPSGNDADQKVGNQQSGDEQLRNGGTDLGGQDKAGPSSTERSGESEDVSGDGTKERGVKNSATEGKGGIDQSQNAQDTADKNKTSDAAGNKQGDQTSPAPSTPDDEEDTAESLERKKQIKAQAKTNQINTIGRHATTVKVIGNTLKALAKNEEFQSSNVQSARKAIDSAAKELSGVLEDEEIGSGLAGITSNKDGDVISFANGLTTNQKLGIIVSHIDAAVAELKNAKEQVGRSKHSTTTNSTVDNLEAAKEYLLKEQA